MEIEILRTYTEKATYGKGKVIDNEKHDVAFEFVTLELPNKGNAHNISCIPEGTYLVEKCKPTAKRKYEYFHILNVPDRNAILMHPGNYTRDILGCVLPGEHFADLDEDGIQDVVNTTATLKILTAMMPDKFKMTIKKSEV